MEFYLEKQRREKIRNAPEHVIFENDEEKHVLLENGLLCIFPKNKKMIIPILHRRNKV